MEVIKRDGATAIFSWCPNIEEQAMEQMEVISQLPYTKHCALMPDAHWGQNMCIGGVVACDNVVVPDFVGVDIGCGMGAIKTNLERSDLDEDRLNRLLHSFQRGIPVGFSHNTQKRANELKNSYKEKVEYILHGKYNTDLTRKAREDLKGLLRQPDNLWKVFPRRRFQKK